MNTFSRRRFLGLGALTPFIGGCRSGSPTLFGYHLGADALYDQNIKTVYVHAFQNRAIQTTPYREFEVDLTKALVDEIGRTTTFRVSSNPDSADTELIGVLMAIDKRIMNRTQQNTVRDGEVVVGVDVLWRDLRDGTILSAPKKGRPPAKGTTPGPTPIEPQPVPFDPNVPIVPPLTENPGPIPVRLVAAGRYIQELGETNASAMKRVQNQMAVQIVSMMEKKW